MVQGHVRVTSWGFESPLRHYFFARQKNSFENLVRVQDGAHEARHFFCGWQKHSSYPRLTDGTPPRQRRGGSGPCEGDFTGKRVLRQRRISLRLRVPPSALFFFALQKNSFENISPDLLLLQKRTLSLLISLPILRGLNRYLHGKIDGRRPGASRSNPPCSY